MSAESTSTQPDPAAEGADARPAAPADGADRAHGGVSKALTFRPDIQGIRALAVLLVMVNHLVPRRLTGGYIGVDVFFVVSGFLITSLLVKEAGRSERISLAGFYARRARRIIPAATFVLVATVLVSLWKFPLLRAKEVLTDAVWSTFFAANVRLADVGTDYFAQDQPPSPFRHYWSLAVEEQFYLVWPLLLIVCLVVVRRLHRGKSDPAAVHHRFRVAAWVVIAVAIAASLAWSVLDTHTSPVTAYYSSLARGWELGAGAACALVVRRRPVLPHVLRELLAAAGLLTVLGSAVLLSDATQFPGLWALLPVLGTVALVVAGGAGEQTLVARGLSLRPATLVGDWSYSLYLWHWPIIVVLRGTGGPDRWGGRGGLIAIAVVASFVLAWLSYTFVENPFRRGTWKKVRWSLVIYPVSIATVLVVVAGGNRYISHELGTDQHNAPIAVEKAKPGDDQYVTLVKSSVRAAKEGQAVPSELMPDLLDLKQATADLGDCDYRTGTHRLCPQGTPGASRTIVVLGDSFGRALSPAIDKIGEEHGYQVYVLVYSGCQATTLDQIDNDTNRVWQDCADFKSWALDTIADLHPDVTVVASSVGKVVDPDTGAVVGPSENFERFLQVLDQGWQGLIQRLKPVSGRVIAFGNTPRIQQPPTECLSDGHPDLGDCISPPGSRSRRAEKVLLDAARAQGATAVNAQKWFCADGLCPTVIGPYIAMRDTDHMTPDYARWLAPAIAAAMGLDRA